MKKKSHRKYGRLFQDRIRFYKDKKTTKHTSEIFLDNCQISLPENERMTHSGASCPGEHIPVLIEIKSEATCDICIKTMYSGQIRMCNKGCNWRCCNTCFRTTQYAFYIIPMSGTKEKVFRNKLVFRRFKEREAWMIKIYDVRELLKEDCKANIKLKTNPTQIKLLSQKEKRTSHKQKKTKTKIKHKVT